MVTDILIGIGVGVTAISLFIGTAAGLYLFGVTRGTAASNNVDVSEIGKFYKEVGSIEALRQDVADHGYNDDE